MGVCGATVIVIGKGLDKLSLNPGRALFAFHFALMLLGKA